MNDLVNGDKNQGKSYLIADSKSFLKYIEESKLEICTIRNKIFRWISVILWLRNYQLCSQE